MSFLGKIKIVMLKGEKGDQGEAGSSGNYAGLTNKPSINNVALSGNKNSDDLGLASQTALESLDDNVYRKTDVYTKDEVYTKNEVVDVIYPVGAIFMSVVDTNPSTYLGGTWVAWGAGKVPVGVDASDTDFDTVEETGGEKTHTLSSGEIPSHTHTTTDIYPVAGQAVGIAPGSTYIPKVETIESTTRTTSSAGSGSAHNNLQPYITCYMWKRTA